jgi:hypothetical protein
MSLVLNITSQVWWYILVITGTYEAEIGQLQFEVKLVKPYLIK